MTAKSADMDAGARAIHRLGSRDWAVATAIATGVALLFARTAGFPFISLDDSLYVKGHEVVGRGLTWEGLTYAFTSFSEGNYLPLTWLSYMATAEFWGEGPAAHHAVNVVLHAVNSALLYLFLRLGAGAAGRSAMVALLFGAHPLRVESVAWIAERKDVLSGLFWMLSLLAYLAYARRSTAARYALLVACFAGGLLSKSMVVTLPCVLLLLDWWPLDRWRTAGTRRVLAEKLPLIVLAAFCSVATFLAQRGAGALSDTASVPLISRMWNTPSSYGIYLLQTFWPAKLAVMYPYLSARELLLRGLAGGAAMAVISGIAIAGRRTRPYLGAGWLWYLGALVPVIGLVQVGVQAHADRYTYLPHIGLLVAGVWAISGVLDRAGWTLGQKVAAGATVVILFAGAAWRQIGFWRDSETLVTHAMAVTGDNAFAEMNYAVALIERQEYARAEEHMRHAMAIEAPRPWDFHNLGNLLFVQGKVEDAQYYLTLAVLNDPGLKESWALLGDLRLRLGQAEAAVDAYRKAIALGVDGWELRGNLARALARSNRPAEAAIEFEAALLGNPEDPALLLGYGGLLAGQSRIDEASALLERGLAGGPENAEGAYYLGVCRAVQGRSDEALALLVRAFAGEPTLRGRAAQEPLLAPLRSRPEARPVFGEP